MHLFKITEKTFNMKICDMLGFGGGIETQKNIAIAAELTNGDKILSKGRNPVLFLSMTQYFVIGWIALSLICSLPVKAAAATIDVQPLNISLGSNTVTTGGTLLVSWQIRNNGTGTAGTSNSQVRITTSNAANGYGNSSNNVGTARATGTIAAGVTINQSTIVTVPSTPGTYYVWVIADNNSNLTQSNVNNDYAVCTTALTGLP